MLKQKRYLLLSVNDLQSILDAAREGISIIGTDLVRQWSRSGRALCLDLTTKEHEGNGDTAAITMGGTMDLRDERYARDSSPLLPGKRARNKNDDGGGTGDQQIAPSFTRAYIHHLIKAREMLAETLLFMHNLDQMLLLFRRLDEAASLDDEDGSGNCGKKNLHAFCRKIQDQL